MDINIELIALVKRSYSSAGLLQETSIERTFLTEAEAKDHLSKMALEPNESYQFSIEKWLVKDLWNNVLLKLEAVKRRCQVQ